MNFSEIVFRTSSSVYYDMENKRRFYMCGDSIQFILDEYYLSFYKNSLPRERIASFWMIYAITSFMGSVSLYLRFLEQPIK